MAFGFEFPHVHNYDSDLREVLYYLKKLEEEYANIETLYDEINAKLGAMEDKYNEIIAYYAKIPSMISDSIEAALEEYRKELDKDIADMNDKLDDFSDYLAKLQALMMKYTDDKVDGLLAQFRLEIYQYSVALQRQINELRKMFQELPDSFYVYCQPCGWHKPIQHTLDDIYNSAREKDGLTVGQYEAYGLTVGQYDEYQMSAIKYAMYAKAILNRFWYWHFNPIIGTQHTVANIASWLATEHYHTPTVAEYEEEDLTVEGWEEKEMTVREYLEQNYQKMRETEEWLIEHYLDIQNSLTLGKGGLTVSEYATVGVIS